MGYFIEYYFFIMHMDYFRGDVTVLSVEKYTGGAAEHLSDALQGEESFPGEESLADASVR